MISVRQNLTLFFSLLVIMAAADANAAGRFLRIPMDAPGFTRLPSKNVHAALFQNGQIFALHSFGLSMSQDLGASWQSFPTNELPPSLKNVNARQVQIPGGQLLSVGEESKTCYGSTYCWTWQWKDSGKPIEELSSVSLLPDGKILLAIQGFGLAKASLTDVRSVEAVAEGLLIGECLTLSQDTKGSLLIRETHYLQNIRYMDPPAEPICEHVQRDKESWENNDGLAWEIAPEEMIPHAIPFGRLAPSLPPNHIPDSTGNLYFLERDSCDPRQDQCRFRFLQKMDTSGKISTVWTASENERFGNDPHLGIAQNGDIVWITNKGYDEALKRSNITFYSLSRGGKITSKDTTISGEPLGQLICNEILPGFPRYGTSQQAFPDLLACATQYLSRDTDWWAFQNYALLADYRIGFADALIQAPVKMDAAPSYSRRGSEFLASSLNGKAVLDVARPSLPGAGVTYSEADGLYGRIIQQLEGTGTYAWNARLFVLTDLGIHVLDGAGL